MSRIVLYRWIGALFLVHNLEEAATMKDFLPRLNTLAARLIDSPIDAPSYPQFLLALALITLLSWGALAILARFCKPRLADLAAASIQGAVGLNAIWHLLMVGLLGVYVPGSATAILFNLPFTLMVFRRLVIPYDPGGILWAFVLGLASLWHGPLLGFLLWMAKHLGV
ncbi:MAG: HXXEE domain-containing protein [Methylococcaceae bacterium]|nr:HXXEE domain-containing protein [Methylococcaceae bacterium]